MADEARIPATCSSIWITFLSHVKRHCRQGAQGVNNKLTSACPWHRVCQLHTVSLDVAHDKTSSP